MSLTNSQRRHLRALGHALEPVVRVGQHGLRPSVLTELGDALDAHELVKVKIAADRDERRDIADELCRETGAEQVQAIGQVVVLFRRNPEKPKIALPSA